MKPADLFDLIAKIFDPDAHFLVRRKNLDDISAHPEAAREQVERSPLVLHVDELAQRHVHALAVAFLEEVGIRVTALSRRSRGVT